MGMQVQAGQWEPQEASAIGTNDSGRAEVSSGQEDEPSVVRSGVSFQKSGPQGHSLYELIYLDYRRYFAAGARNALSVIALTQGFWASTIYRVSHWALGRCRIPGLRVVVKAGCIMLQKFIEVVTGICIPGRSNIGPG